MKLLRNIVLISLGVAVVGFPAYTATGWWVIRHIEPVVYIEMAGQNEADVVATYGQPDSVLPGEKVSGPPPRDGPPPDHPHRTLIYRTHHPLRFYSGNLYVLLEQQDGEWMCLGACWIADGVVF